MVADASGVVAAFIAGGLVLLLATLTTFFGLRAHSVFASPGMPSVDLGTPWGATVWIRGGSGYAFLLQVW